MRNLLIILLRIPSMWWIVLLSLLSRFLVFSSLATIYLGVDLSYTVWILFKLLNVQINFFNHFWEVCVIISLNLLSSLFCLLCCVLSHFSHVLLCAITLWTIARQDPQSMGFSRKNTRVGCVFFSRSSQPRDWTHIS